MTHDVEYGRAVMSRSARCRVASFVAVTNERTCMEMSQIPSVISSTAHPSLFHFATYSFGLGVVQSISARHTDGHCSTRPPLATMIPFDERLPPSQQAQVEQWRQGIRAVFAGFVSASAVSTSEFGSDSISRSENGLGMRIAPSFPVSEVSTVASISPISP